MITFDTTETRPVQISVLEPEPEQKEQPKQVLPLVLLGGILFFIGCVGIGTWIFLEQPEPVLETKNEETHSPLVNRIDEAVTRALMAQSKLEETVLKAETGFAKQVACSTVIQNLAPQEGTVGSNISPVAGVNSLELARDIAREVQGCSDILITVEGHSALSFDEIENLQASWEQAENTIALLASEGLDVSGFRPVGFGSRSIGAEDVGHVSFRVSSGF